MDASGGMRGGDGGGLASYLGACLHRQLQILLYMYM